MMTKFEKRLLAGIMSVMMCFSVVQLPMESVHAEEMFVSEEGDVAQSTSQTQEEDAVEGSMIPIPEKIEVEQPEAEGQISRETWEETVTDIIIGEYETEFTEEDQQISYRFVAEKAGSYCIRMNGNVEAYVESEGFTGTIGWIYKEQKFISLDIGEACNIRLQYADEPDGERTGTVTWSITEITETGIGEKHQETKKEDEWYPVYCFAPETSGTYTVYCPKYLSINFYDDTANRILSKNNRAELEAGKKYYIEFSWYDSDLEWSIEKPEKAEIEAEVWYTANAGKAVDYIFIPEVSGRYQLKFSNDVRYGIYDEELYHGESGYGNSQNVSLEKEQKYLISIAAEEDVNWCIVKRECVEVQANTEYTKNRGKAVDYKFIPETSGKYQFNSNKWSSFYVYDENRLHLDTIYNGGKISLEKGNIYYVTLNSDDQIAWNVKKTEMLEVQQDVEYTLTKGQAVEYHFTPLESRSYQFYFDQHTEFDIYDKNGICVKDGWGWEEIVLLEKDNTYSIHLQSDRTVSWGIKQVEIVGICENKEYTTTSGLPIVYQFIPSESCGYELISNVENSGFEIYDENWNQCRYSEKFMLEKAETYYIYFRTNYSSVGEEVWSIRRIETEEVQTDTEYIKYTNQRKYYRFSPSESGRYKMIFDGYWPTKYMIYDEQWNLISSGEKCSETFSMEEGKSYFIDLQSMYGFSFTKREINWKIQKSEVMEVQMGIKYTTITGQAVEYQFVPTETGEYQVKADVGAATHILDENREEVSRKLEKGKTYYIHFDMNRKVNWNILKPEEVEKEIVEVFTGAEYCIMPGKNVRYRFVPKESGQYKFICSTDTDFCVYDANSNYVGCVDGNQWSISLKCGEIYYFSLRVDEKTNWSIKKVSVCEVQQGEKYVKRIGETVDYQFMPKSSGRYQMFADTEIKVAVYNADGEYVRSWSGQDKKIYLEKDEIYHIYFFDYDSVNWSISATEQKDISKDITYTTKAENAIDYRFLPQKTSSYLLYLSDDKSSCTILDENWEVVESLEYLSSTKEDLKVLLTAGETYYLDFTIGGDSTEWKLEEPKTFDEYDYRVKEDGTIDIIKYRGESQSLVIPEMIEEKKITGIAGEAFSKNLNIEEIWIPKGVTELEYDSFVSCSNLRNVKFEPDSELKKIGDYVFRYCNNLKDIKIPDGVKKIGEAAFYETGLIQLDIPDSVTELGSRGFESCANLQKITIGKGVVSIARRMFYGCPELKEVNWGQESELETIEAYAFAECRSFRNMELPNSVRSLKQNAFEGAGLLTITLPDNVIEVGEYLFAECDLLQSVKIGAGVQNISSFMFAGCTQLAQVDFQTGTSNSGSNVTKIEYGAFIDCKSLGEFQIPDTVQSMSKSMDVGDSSSYQGDSLWYDNQEEGVVYLQQVLYQYKGKVPENSIVTVRKGTKVIAGYAFEGQYGLKGIEIPNGVVNIGKFAFFDCSDMKEVVIPSSVNEIEPFALGYVKGEIIGSGGFYTTTFNQKIDGFTIYGKAGSEAQQYAEENDFEFIAVMTQEKGDINDDANIDSADLRLVLRAVCGKETLTDTQETAADVEGNGNGVDSQDMRKILQFVCGKIDEL